MAARRFISRLTCLAAALCLSAAAVWANKDAPRRVVSMNLCTDQLAMLLAAPDQLHSVSSISLDPRMSPMTDKAQGYVINQGRAEEIYLMQPDLVLAGTYTARASVAMLERLGVTVVTFEQAQSLPEIRALILRMGAVLNRQDTAQAMVAAFDARLAAIGTPPEPRPQAMLVYANGYTAPQHTLADEILRAAGFDNAAVAAGFADGSKLPLEVLALSQPDIVITSQPYPGFSRSEAIMDHPVLQRLRQTRPEATVTDHDWVCGTPYVLRAIEALAQTRQGLTQTAQ